MAASSLAARAEQERDAARGDDAVERQEQARRLLADGHRHAEGQDGRRCASGSASGRRRKRTDSAASPASRERATRRPRAAPAAETASAIWSSASSPSATPASTSAPSISDRAPPPVDDERRRGGARAEQRGEGLEIVSATAPQPSGRGGGQPGDRNRVARRFRPQLRRARESRPWMPAPSASCAAGGRARSPRLARRRRGRRPPLRRTTPSRRRAPSRATPRATASRSSARPTAELAEATPDPGVEPCLGVDLDGADGVVP